MTRPGLLLAASSAASLAFLVARAFTLADWTVLLKVLCILLLAVPGFRADRLLGTALAISGLGDFFLGIHRAESFDEESLFLPGLGAFLLAHLFYIVMFHRYRATTGRRLSPARTAGVLAILAAVASVLVILWHSLGPMLVPVLVYALVLAGMGISALLADLGTPLAAFGALSFIASDTMLALNKFHASFPGHEPLIWITYYLAQLLILCGILRHRSRTQSTTRGFEGDLSEYH